MPPSPGSPSTQAAAIANSIKHPHPRVHALLQRAKTTCLVQFNAYAECMNINMQDIQHKTCDEAFQKLKQCLAKK